MDSAPETATPLSKGKIARTSDAFIISSIVLLVLAIVFSVMSPTIAGPRPPVSPQVIDSSKLRAIGVSIFNYASDNSSGTLPSESATDIYEVAARLAKSGALSDPSIWISQFDQKYPKLTIPSSVLDLTASDPKTAELSPVFGQAPLAFAVAIFPAGVGRITMPASTPIAWTRGLLTDGTWSKNRALYGDWGGSVVFIDGHVKTFKGGINGGLVKYGTNLPTSNILEALPPGSRISEFKPPMK